MGDDLAKGFRCVACEAPTVRLGWVDGREMEGCPHCGHIQDEAGGIQWHQMRRTDELIDRRA